MPDSVGHLEALSAIAQHNHISLEGVIPPDVDRHDYILPDNGRVLLTVNLVLASTALLVVLVRFYTRLCVAGSVGGDDVTIGAAMTVVAGSTVLNCLAVQYAGVGRHFYDLTTLETERLLKFTYALPIIYSLGVVTIKMSILLFYRRLFGYELFLQKIVRYFLLFQLVFAAGSILTFALICSPVQAWWILEMRVVGCPSFRQMTAVYVSLRVVTVLCDIGVLCLPMRMVWQLELPVLQRLGLLGIFTLGFVACAVAVARFSLIPRLCLSLDVSWNVLPIALLDQTEQCLGIITASIPALTALISKGRPRRAPPPFTGDPKRIYGQESFDFLAFAYDPDRQNMGCHAMAYSTAGRSRGKVAEEHDEDEQLVHCGGLGMISKTTTVTVHVTHM